MDDKEVQAIVTINQVLGDLDDPAARSRVLKWAAEKFATGLTTGTATSSTTRTDTGVTTGTETRASRATLRDNEIPGIARLSTEGEFQLTVRDPKARSATDAALRLALVAIRAHQQLTGEESTSSRKVLLPILKDWRVYDGNTRKAMADHKGIIRTGDKLSLDAHARTEADKYIDEIVDETLTGSWKPGQKSARRKSKTKESAAADA